MMSAVLGPYHKERCGINEITEDGGQILAQPKRDSEKRANIGAAKKR